MNLNSIINKGLLEVYGPLVSFVVLCGFISNWIVKDILKYDSPDIIVAIIVIIAVMLGWLWWSYKIVKWKFWAFSQLDYEESEELYIKSIEVGLIWPTGNIFNKTEIWTKSDKEKWSNLSQEIQFIFKTIE